MSRPDILLSGPDFGRGKGEYFRVEVVLKSKIMFLGVIQYGLQNGYLSLKPHVEGGSFPLNGWPRVVRRLGSLKNSSLWR